MWWTLIKLEKERFLTSCWSFSSHSIAIQFWEEGKSKSHVTVWVIYNPICSGCGRISWRCSIRSIWDKLHIIFHFFFLCHKIWVNFLFDLRARKFESRFMSYMEDTNTEGFISIFRLLLWHFGDTWRTIQIDQGALSSHSRNHFTHSITIFVNLRLSLVSN